MADVQILRAPSSAVPSDYALPGAADLLLKAVYAEFDGSGAAADWLPCVTILSDSGDVIARAVDQAVKVTAGSSADVSWFRGVKHAAAASGVSGAPDTVRLFTGGQAIPSVPGGFSGEMPWPNGTKIVTGTNIWTYTLDGGGNVVEVLASAPGLYEMFVSGTFDPPSALTTESLLANVFGTIPAADQYTTGAVFFTAGGAGGTVGLMTSFASGTAQFSTQVDFDRNTTGVFNGDEWWIKHWTI